MFLRKKILNTEILSITTGELLTELKEGALFTPNLDHLMKLQSDREFYEIYKKAEWVVCDSRILYLAMKLAGQKIPEPIPGSSFFPAFCDYHAEDQNCRIFLLGAKEGVAQKAMENINNRIGRNIVVGAHSPSFGFEKNDEEIDSICQIINNSQANVVLVGVGAPKQEKFIMRHKAKMPNVKIWMALGATIDFEAGNVKRAPKIFQMCAMEWFYRFLMEPKRLWKRYFVEDMPFFWLLTKQMLGIYNDPWKKEDK